MQSCLKLDTLKSKHTQGDMVSKIKFYMDYFVSKLSLIYFSTFSGNRFNSDYIKITILELVVAGCFKNQLSQEIPFGTLEEMPRSFSFFNQRPHTSASLLHSHLNPCDSAMSVKTKQTARPQRPLLQCLVVLHTSLLARGWQRHGKKWRARALDGSQLAARPPCQAPLRLAAPAQAALCPYHRTCSSSQARTKSPGSWTSLTERASITGWVTGPSPSRGKSHVRHPTQSRRISSRVSSRVWAP